MAAQTATQTVRTPKQLTSYQRELVCAPWYDPKTNRAAIDAFQKARRIGGSTSAAFRSALLALGREMREDGTAVIQRPMDVWVVSKDFSGSKGLLHEIASCCEELAPLDPDFIVDAKQTVITFPATGKTVTALACSAPACRGKTGALVGDEVAFWRMQQEVYGAAKLIADPNLGEPRGYPILWITTPWEEGSVAHRIFTDESLPFRRSSVDIYQAVAAGFPIDPERAFEELGIPELVASEYLVKWAKGGLAFFPIAKLRDAQVDDDDEGDIHRSGLPASWPRARTTFGIDVGGGRGRDFTAAVRWCEIGEDVWLTGVRANNDLAIDEQADYFGDWILDTDPATEVEVRVDEGVMGGALIDLLTKKLRHRKRTRVIGVGMMPADQERYAKAGKRLLERGRMKLYSGRDAGGDKDGVRSFMLELSQLKTRPGEGGRLTFATPRDGTGHRDRAWAGLLALDEVEEGPPVRPTPDQMRRMASAGRFGGASRGFG